MTLDSIKNAIKANPALAASLAALLFACLALAFAQGCDMRRMVKVDAPKDLLAAVDVPEPAEGITLAEDLVSVAIPEEIDLGDHSLVVG